MILWVCLSFKKQLGIMLKIGTLISACDLALTTSDRVGQKFPKGLIDTFSLHFGKNMLSLFVISNECVCICFSTCLFFLIMLINKSRLILLRAVTLAPADG